MATSGSEDIPEAAPRPERNGRRRWIWLIVAASALLGFLLGVGVVLRGRSLGSSAPGDVVTRPTFAIGTSVIPIASRSPSPLPAETATAAAEYIVQSGDTLRSIAQDVYGDADQWPRIYAANRDVIGADPDQLEAGMRLQVP